MELNLSVNLLRKDQILPYLLIPLIGLSLGGMCLYLLQANSFMAWLGGIAGVTFSIPLLMHFLNERHLARNLFFSLSLVLLTSYSIILGPASGLHYCLLLLSVIPIISIKNRRQALLATGACLVAFLIAILSPTFAWQRGIPPHFSYDNTFTIIAQILITCFLFVIIFLERNREFVQQAQLDLHSQELEIENRFLQHIGYHMTHDFGQSMRIITQNCQLLAEKYHQSKQHFSVLEEEIQIIEANSRRAHDLITEISMYLSIKEISRKGTLLDLHEIVSEVQDMMADQIEAAGVRLSVVGPLPYVKALRFEWIFLFQNLIENAIKYGDKEYPAIIISGLNTQEEQVLIIQDNGIGIKPDAREHIFEPFYRSQNSHNTHGTGLGLFICKEIVERRNGNIRVESEPGIGTSFIISLPANPKR